MSLCVENTLNLDSIENSFFYEAGLFFNRKEVSYHNYTRPKVRVIGVNDNLCILLRAVFSGGDFIEMDEVRVFNKYGGVTTCHPQKLSKYVYGCLTVETDVHLNEHK